MNNFTSEMEARYEELRRKGGSRNAQEKEEYAKLESLKNLPEQGNEQKGEETVSISKSQFEALFAEIKTLRDEVKAVKNGEEESVQTEGWEDEDLESKPRIARMKIWQPRSNDTPKIFVGWHFLGESYNAKGQLDLDYEFVLRDPEGKEEKVSMPYSAFAKINKFINVDIIDINKSPKGKTYGKVKKKIQETNDLVETSQLVPLKVVQDFIFVTIKSDKFGEVTLESKFLNT